MTAPRWYMVNKDGMATLCTSKKDAEKEARAMNIAWPHMGPHRAVQLVEVGTSAPAWADQAVIEYRYTGGTHWCPLGSAERMRPNFDGVYRLQAGVYPVEQVDTKAAPAAVAGPVAFTAEHVTYIRRYGGSCRDCADENGVCPNRGLPCADSEKAIRFVLEALAYGINHGYIAAPTTQPAPQQEAQEPVMIYHGDCTIDCGEHGHHHVELLRMIPAGSKLYTAPQPSSASQGDALDAARYRHLRDCNSGSLVVMQITGSGEDDWHVLTEDDADAAIDAARAAQEGK